MSYSTPGCPDTKLWPTALCSLCSTLKPPQPTKICRDEAEAIAFLRAKCQTARSWGDGGKDAPRRGKTASTVRASPEGGV